MYLSCWIWNSKQDKLHVMKEQDRPIKILQAYPGFKELGHVGIYYFHN